MPKRPESDLTQRRIAAIKTGSRTGRYIADRSTPGFALRVYQHPETGELMKAFVVRYTVRGPRPVRRNVALGRYGVDVTLEQAREKARMYLSAARDGKDLMARAAVPTWEEWTKRFLASLDVKRPQEHQRYLGYTAETAAHSGAPTDPTFREIRARWSARPLDTFTPDDVEQARQVVREGGKARAARWLACVRAAFSSAVRLEIIPKNPAAALRPDRPSAGRERVLSDGEYQLLAAALEREDDPHAAAGIALLALTGARLGEVLALEWVHVDLEARIARVPDSKSGKPRLLALPPAAVEIVKALPRVGRFVVAGRAGTRRPDLKGPWRRATQHAGITGASLHDLRRSWGLRVNREAGMRVAQLGLGHGSVTTTEEHYTPESFGNVLRAADAVASVLPFRQRAAG